MTVDLRCAVGNRSVRHARQPTPGNATPSRGSTAFSKPLPCASDKPLSRQLRSGGQRGTAQRPGRRLPAKLAAHKARAPVNSVNLSNLVKHFEEQKTNVCTPHYTPTSPCRSVPSLSPYRALPLPHSRPSTLWFLNGLISLLYQFSLWLRFSIWVY